MSETIQHARESVQQSQEREGGQQSQERESAQQSQERESAQKSIVRQVSAWPGVTSGPHRFGGVELRYGRRELGHVHGDKLVDLPFPLLIREQLVAAGKAEAHHVHPESGWVSVFIRDERDVERVVELFRLNYERPWANSSWG